MNRRGVAVRGVTIEGAAASGIHIGYSHNFTLDQVIVRNTRANAIQVTETSSNGSILRLKAFNTGEDSVVFFSVKSYGAQVNNILLQSPEVHTVRRAEQFLSGVPETLL